MNPAVNRTEIEATTSLREAIARVFSISPGERACLLPNEAMTGELAEAYNKLSREARQGTYQNLAADFLARTNYQEKGRRPRILDAGCGSGLLSLELAQRTNTLIIGVDASQDMIKLANKNRREMNLDANVFFFPENLYSLSELTGGEPHFDYVVCRNVLHRLKDPQEAIRQMRNSLNPNGKIYIRDLRRDADWPTIVRRIGEQRWQHPELVRDYIGAMAQMLTLPELEQMLGSLHIIKYKLTNGEYAKPEMQSSALKEYQKDVEYVCVINES
ncbi:MAG: class I SAM-dependent methyltransferase [Nanoarchaeota archaeon]|nr:class I SAM-dependent methyltransferase [Nanoarchaeota archaeon]MBU0977096.1 class I SAM-dependent methyltransferase [Nanoarchaeota archaeon]